MDKHEQGRQNRIAGRWGEALVANDLRERGWIIHGAGYYTRFGEIDLIAQDGMYLVFVEVKLRRDASHGTAAEAVDHRKRQRIISAAKLFLAQNPTELQPRFDVAEVYAPQGTQSSRPDIHYIENAFTL